MSRSGPLSALEYQQLARLRSALRALMRFSDEMARSAGLTPAQHQLLLAIKGHAGPGEPCASDVANALLLRLHSAVELINRAEAAGLLTRRTDPADGRRQLLSLTRTGEARLGAISRFHRHELARLATMVAAVGQPD